MKVVALQLGHNATAAIMEDGVILGAVSQEKFDNIKNSSAFPIDAARALCAFEGWRLEDLDHVLLSSRHIYPPAAFQTIADKAGRENSTNFVVRQFRKAERTWLGQTFPAIFDKARAVLHARKRAAGDQYVAEQLQGCELHGKPTTRVEHHLCHARAAYHGLCPTSQKGRPALVVTMDGEGDEISSTVSVVDEAGHLRRIASNPVECSLGWVYSATTRFLGMKALEHEYKVMGLAPYAKSYYLETYERLFKPVIGIDPADPLKFQSKLNTAHFYDYLVDHAVGQRFDNLAAAAQHLIEDLAVAWIRNAVAKTGIRTVYTGGGLFMNVKLNKRILELPEIEQVFFMPSCGDESLPIGALYDFAARNGMQTKPLSDLYLGRSYTDQEIAAFIEERGLASKYDVARFDDIDGKVAELLAERQVVARFAERCEWGARSLGNRALLAHPSHMESFYTVNDQIKVRDFWMPFAPSVLDSYAERYLKGFDPRRNAAPYMITAYDATPTGLTDLRAALHQGDHTLRPQVVTPQGNPRYHALIQRFANLTGVGAVLNTSLNLHGYPLVGSPEQALFTFDNSGLRILALGSYLIQKR